MTPLPIAVAESALSKSASAREGDEPYSVDRRKPTEIQSGTTSTTPFPSSRKVYIGGRMYPQLRVPMREISLTATEVAYGGDNG